MQHSLIRLGRQVPKIRVSEIHEHPLLNVSLHTDNRSKQVINELRNIITFLHHIMGEKKGVHRVVVGGTWGEQTTWNTQA